MKKFRFSTQLLLYFSGLLFLFLLLSTAVFFWFNHMMVEKNRKELHLESMQTRAMLVENWLKQGLDSLRIMALDPRFEEADPMRSWSIWIWRFRIPAACTAKTATIIPT